MRSTTFTTLLTLLTATVSAIPLTTAANAITARAPAKEDCNALTEGIQKHLAIQKNESADVKNLQSSGEEGFAAGKAKLDADLAAGKAQKAANVEAAAKVGSSEVTSILDAIGTAQVRVTELVGGLQGGDADQQALDELADLFSSASDKNRDALEAAKTACKA